MSSKIRFRITFWQIALVLILIALVIWWWFDQQISMIDSRIDNMQNH